MSGNSIREYLGQVELAVKQRAGAVPEQVLYDVYQNLSASAAGQSSGNPTEAIRSCDSPEAIASSVGIDPQPPATGVAPGWRICCTRCGRSSPAATAGITRIGARSVHKYTFGRCQTCQRVTPCRLLRDLETITLTDPILDGKTPDQIRKTAHHPWLTVVAIVLLVVLINAAVWWLIWGNG